MVDVVPDDALGLLQPRVGEGERAIERLRELGHRVAHHAVYPHVDLDERFDPVVAWHNPDPEFMQAEIPGAVNVMSEPFFDPEHYRSDSNQHWRHGCPHDELAAGAVRVAAAPDAPGDLGVRGRDDARVDGVVPRRRPCRAPRAPAARQHRPLVKPITVMVTASGAPGTAALLRALRENGEREVRLVGTDMSERVGRPPSLRLVPRRSRRRRPRVPRRDARGRERESVDAILPQSSFDLEGLAEHVDRFPMPVLVSSPDAIHRSNDKAETYALLHRLGVPAPEFRRVNGARRGRRRRTRARLPGPAGLLQAGVLVGLARLPRSSTRPSTARTSC